MAIIVPVYTLMAVLKYLNVLQVVAGWCRPAMKYFGLPGDAAFALVLGNFLNLYSAIGVIAALKLTSAQMTLLSIILLFSHSQILESSVFFQIRTKYGLLLAIRLATALLAGWALHFIICPNGAASASAAVDYSTRAANLHAALLDYLGGVGRLALEMLLVLVAIFLLLEIIKRLNLLEKSLKTMNRATAFMGFSKEAGLPLLAGIIFGIVFGAGVITGSVKEHALGRKQVLLVSLFLALSHGMVEDTGLMVVLGANILWITIPRLLLAVPVVWLVNRLWHPKLAESNHRLKPMKVKAK
jgi:hypothetical protein